MAYSRRGHVIVELRALTGAEKSHPVVSFPASQRHEVILRAAIARRRPQRLVFLKDGGNDVVGSEGTCSRQPRCWCRRSSSS